MKEKPLSKKEKVQLEQELYKRYGESQTWGQRILYFRKKYAWFFVINLAKWVKRVLDIVISLFLSVLLSPFFLLIATLIKAADGGPILYISNRVGKWGKEFRFPKFRSMCIGADNIKESLTGENIHKDDQITFKIKDDPRVTRIGKIIRKTSLDELPQLWCVIKGEMSLVGPRPPLPEEVAKYTLADRRRLDITPGLTCIWQVSGRADISFEKQVQLDLEYIESQSIWLDIKLLLKTIPAVLFGRGAY